MAGERALRVEEAESERACSREESRLLLGRVKGILDAQAGEKGEGTS